jgi:predicted Zn-dependent peptidase
MYNQHTYGRFLFERLENGIRLLAIETPHSRIAYGSISVQVGGRYETESSAGISHMLEHLLFEEGSSFKPLTTIRRMGGSVNAVTDMELTTYHFTVLPRHFEEAMHALSRMVLEPQLDGEDLEREREVVLEELATGRNDPRAVVLTQLIREIFPGSPMNSFVIGTKESIDGLSISEIQDFYSTYYAPSNLIVIAAGGIHASDTLRTLRAMFQSYGTTSTPKKPLEVPVPAINRMVKKIPIRQSFYVYGALSPGKNEDDYQAMAVLDALFASGVNSRLHRRLVMEGGYTEQIYPNWFSYSNTGIWAVFLSLRPEDMDAVASLIRREMDGMKRGSFSSEELEAAKESLISSMRIWLNRPENIAKFQLENLAYKNRIVEVSEYLSSIEKVDRFDVMRVAASTFSQEGTVTIEMQPARGPERWYLILKYLTTKSI